VFLIEYRPTFQRFVLPPPSGPDDGGSTYSWNVGRHPVNNMAVHPRRFWASTQSSSTDLSVISNTEAARIIHYVRHIPVKSDSSACMHKTGITVHKQKHSAVSCVLARAEELLSTLSLVYKN
jgi:hypothetical protein